jgi:hypothetical protein
MEIAERRRFEPAKSEARNHDTMTGTLDISSPRGIWDERRFGPRAPEDTIAFRRWRLGFFVFYSATALLLVGGFALVADRPATMASAAAPATPTIVSTQLDPARHRN